MEKWIRTCEECCNFGAPPNACPNEIDPDTDFQCDNCMIIICKECVKTHANNCANWFGDFHANKK